MRSCFWAIWIIKNRFLLNRGNIKEFLSISEGQISLIIRQIRSEPNQGLWEVLIVFIDCDWKITLQKTSKITFQKWVDIFGTWITESLCHVIGWGMIVCKVILQKCKPEWLLKMILVLRSSLRCAIVIDSARLLVTILDSLCKVLPYNTIVHIFNRCIVFDKSTLLFKFNRIIMPLSQIFSLSHSFLMLILLLKILNIFIFLDSLKQSWSSIFIHLDKFLCPELFQLCFGILVYSVPKILSLMHCFRRILKNSAFVWEA